MFKSMKALVVVATLSIAAVSAAQAGGRVVGSDFHNVQTQARNGGHVHNDGGKVTGSDFHNGASAATKGQSQRQNGGHVHNDGGGKVGSDF